MIVASADASTARTPRLRQYVCSHANYKIMGTRHAVSLSLAASRDRDFPVTSLIEDWCNSRRVAQLSRALPCLRA